MDDELSKFYDECKEEETPIREEDKKEEASADPTQSSILKSETNNEIKPEIDSQVEESAVTPSNETKEAETEQQPKENIFDQTKAQENTRYEGDVCIYTNPETKQEFVWNNEMKQWVPRDYKPVFDGSTYKFTNSKGTTHKWNSEKSQWEESKADENSEVPAAPDKTVYGFDGENHTYTDPKDNTVYIWDKEKSAWFPKVDDDFMARYQMNYGFVDNVTREEPKPVEKAEKRKAPEPPTWFDMDDEHNTKVYVSNLPLDITEKQFIDFMQKCGLVLKDMKTNKFKIKLYTEPDGSLKGDALCDYIKVESVALALNVLDGADLNGKKVKVQRAKFQMRGEYDPSLKPKKKRKKEKEKEKRIQEKLLDWRPDKLRGEREKHEKTVVIKNLFTPATFDENVELILEYTEDIRSEATKCGTVRKVVLYDKHPEGIATVTFSEAEEADTCINLLNNRWFGKRKIIAETWDGKTKYKVVESASETKERLDKWNKFLESDDRVRQ